ncbi:exocyst complex component 2-like [Ornithodoros turicata]
MPGDPPKVTGLSPVEGPPGTKVTIRGENLGLSQSDIVSLTICGADCSIYAEWKSSSKIVARTRACTGRGEVIVTTKSGGRGTCTVQFKGILEVIGPTVESATWVDESSLFTDSLGRKHPTSPSQLQPDDPLGISDESAKKLPEDELRKLFPDGSGNLLSDTFNPTWYLLENYNGTSFNDLKAGLLSLRRKVGQQQEGPSSFLKSHVNAIVICLDVLQELQKTMEKDKQEMGADLTEKLYNSVVKSKSEAENIFESILARKDQADSTRNALGILQKFRFLFNLPMMIERNIQKGDYDVVINDYARAKSVFENTEVAVFQRVYQDVEQKVQRFRNTLMDSLKQLPTPVEDQKRIIKYLVSLGAPGSPAWDAICQNYNWLVDSMDTCKRSHIAALSQGENEDKQQSSDESTHQVKLPQQVQFVEEVTGLFQKHFPDLSDLGQAYFAEGLFVPPNDTITARSDEEKAFKEMVVHIVAKLCWEVRVALLPSSHHSLANQVVTSAAWPGQKSSEGLGPWLPQCLRYIRQCFSSLLKLDIPEETIPQVQQLIFDLRVHSMMCLFNQAAEDVRNLLKSEFWRLEKDDHSGGTTQLPLMFENRVIEALQLVRQNVLQSGPRETEVFQQLNVQGTIKQQVQALLQAFVETLEKCALSPDRLSPIIDSAVGTEVISAAQKAKNWKRKREDSLSTPPLEQRLLIVLSNITFTSRVVIPRLQESFERHGYPDMSSVTKTILNSLANLDRKLFQKLLDAKCDPIVGGIEPNLYAGAFDWKNCPVPVGVSPYIREVLMSMAEVHAEVFSTSPSLVARIMTPLVQGIVEEIARVYECVDKFTKYGNMQATLDLRALEEAVDLYRTHTAGKYFSVCRSKLDPFATAKDKELVDELLKKFQSQMRLQLLCFKENVVCV